MTPQLDAAVAAKLALIPAADQARASAYTQGGHWLMLWSWVVTLAICWLVIRWGVLDRIVGRLGAKRPRPNLTAFVCVWVFALVRWLIGLPWSSYVEWAREVAYGLSNQPYGDWLAQGAIEAVIGAKIAGLFFLGVYALVRRAGRWWPLWASGLAGLFSAAALLLAPVVLLPIFNHYSPAPPGAVREAIADLAREAGVPAAKIYVYDGSRQSNRFTASVSGLGATAQIAMSDTMFQQGASLAEVRAVVSHEMGHYKRQHLVILTVFLTLLFALGFWLIDRLFAPVARGLGRPDLSIVDPAGFPILTALIVSLTLLASPLINSVQRAIEMDADNYSLAHARAPEGLISALIRSTDYRAPAPSGLEEALFYDHPSIAHRIRNALAWEAANRRPAGQ